EVDPDPAQGPARRAGENRRAATAGSAAGKTAPGHRSFLCPPGHPEHHRATVGSDRHRHPQLGGRHGQPDENPFTPGDGLVRTGRPDRRRPRPDRRQRQEAAMEPAHGAGPGCRTRGELLQRS
nr:hypothetical protein [Tanacetum cinerariifolium]